jgi:hypothetical protein
MLVCLGVMRLRNPNFADALDLPAVPIDAGADVREAAAAARRDGCEDVDTDRLGLAPDEIPVRSADS